MSQGAHAPTLRRHWLGRPGWALVATAAAVLVVVPVAMLVSSILHPDTQMWRDQWDTRLPGQIVDTLTLLVGVIAFAGIAANVRLLQLLRSLAGGRGGALRVLFAWLAANLFFGSQLSWVLRPFIGSPSLPVQFLRAEAFEGNFFESVFYTTAHFFN